MTIWKLLGLAALVTAAATVLLTTTTASAGGKEQSQTLVWWHNVTQGPGVKLYKDIAAEFQKLHPGITIKAVPLQNEQFKTKIPIALQSDSPPDIFQSWGGGGLVDQQKAGKVADLTKYVKPWIKTIGGTAAGWQVNGKQYAVPYSVGVVGFWYNKQLFKQAGIASPPKTWPQFLAAVAKLKQAGITPIAIGSKDEWPDAFYWDYLATKLCSAEVSSEACPHRPCSPDTATCSGATSSSCLPSRPSASANSHAASRCPGSAARASRHAVAAAVQSPRCSAARALRWNGWPARLVHRNPAISTSPSGSAEISTAGVGAAADPAGPASSRRSGDAGFCPHPASTSPIASRSRISRG